MTTLLIIIMAPFSIFGLFVLAMLAYDWWDTKYHSVPFDGGLASKPKNGYIPDSPMVQRFQKLAGINRRYGRFDLTNI